MAHSLALPCGRPRSLADGEYKGCGKLGSNRQTGGQAITDCIGKIPAAERTKQVMVIDSDLGGSTAMTKVQDAYPEVYIQSGIMERGTPNLTSI